MLSDDTISKGLVYLVGAGPSDPMLLTLRGKEVMDKCDVVAYDALVSSSLLTFANPNAELVYVGYRDKEGPRSFGMHPKVVEASKQGKTVVRLKAGDPLMFSRGSQEIEDLLAEDIPFEIIPGITAGLALASYGPFPLTHRDFSSDVTFVSGHDHNLKAKIKSKSSWKALGGSTGTLVIYMGASKIKENCESLIENGRPKETPAALITHISTAKQKVVTGTLENLAEKTDKLKVKTPGIIVVGEIVVHRDNLNWFGRKPLYSMEVLLGSKSKVVTDCLSYKLRDLGAHVCRLPISRTSKVALPSNFKWEEIDSYNSIIFDGVESCKLFMHELAAKRLDVRSISGLKVGLIDSLDTDLYQFGLRPDFIIRDLCSFDKADFLDVNPFIGKQLIFTSRERALNVEKVFTEKDIENKVIPLCEVKNDFLEEKPPKPNVAVFPDADSILLFLKESKWGSFLQYIPIIVLTKRAYEIAKDHGFKHVYDLSVVQNEDVIDHIIDKVRSLLTDSLGVNND